MVAGAPKFDRFHELAAGYVLDTLSNAEVAEVERLMQHDPVWREEVNRLQTISGMLVCNTPQLHPPSSLRDKIMQANLNSNPQNKSLNITNSRYLLWRNLISILAFISIIYLAIDNFRLRQQQYNFATPLETERVTALLQQPNSRLVGLSGLSQYPNAKGTLLFTPGKWQEVILSLQGLPSLDSIESYNLWLSLDNNQTIYCGKFNTDTDGSVSIRLNPSQVVPKGVKAISLYVNVNAVVSSPNPMDPKVMNGVF